MKERYGRLPALAVVALLTLALAGCLSPTGPADRKQKSDTGDSGRQEQTGSLPAQSGHPAG